MQEDRTSRREAMQPPYAEATAKFYAPGRSSAWNSLPPAKNPRFIIICVRVAGFDKKIGDEALVRSHDPNGFVLELKGNA